MKIVTEDSRRCATRWNAGHGPSARIALEAVISSLSFCELTHLSY
jgi:hypothetical protein